MGKRWGSDVPLIGKSIAKWGKVGQIMSQPCTPEPELWVYAAWKGVAKAFWSVAKPTALAKHGSPTSMSVFGKHNRRGPKTTIGPRYEWNGELIPGPAFQWPQGAGWAMWYKPAQLLRRAGYWLLIADALSTGALAWTSQTYQDAGCPNPTKPLWWTKCGPTLLFPNNVDAPNGNGGSHHQFIALGDTTLASGDSYLASLNVTSAPWGVLPDQFAPATGRIINHGTGEISDTGNAAPNASGDGTMRALARQKGTNASSGSQFLTYEIHAGNGFCIVDGTTAYFQLDAFDNLLADP